MGDDGRRPKRAEGDDGADRRARTPRSRDATGAEVQVTSIAKEFLQCYNTYHKYTIFYNMHK